MSGKHQRRHPRTFTYASPAQTAFGIRHTASPTADAAAASHSARTMTSLLLGRAGPVPGPHVPEVTAVRSARHPPSYQPGRTHRLHAPRSPSTNTDDYGVCTSTAIFFGPQPSLPLLDMYTKGITLHLSRADSRRYTSEVVELLMAGERPATARQKAGPTVQASPLRSVFRRSAPRRSKTTWDLATSRVATLSAARNVLVSHTAQLTASDARGHGRCRSRS